MKRLLITFLFTFSLIFGFALIAPQASAGLFDGFKEEACKGLQSDNQCAESGSGVNALLKTVLNIFSLIVGVIAIIMVIISGLKFVTSGGDPQRASSARNSIIYALVGLIIVALAQIIVRFVLYKVNAPTCPAGQKLNAQNVCVKS